MSEADVYFVRGCRREENDEKEELKQSHSGFLTKKEEMRNNNEDGLKLVTRIFKGVIKQMETDTNKEAAMQYHAKARLVGSSFVTVK